MAIDTFMVYVGVYDASPTPRPTTTLVKDLHIEAGLIDAYDAAVIERRADGKVKITKKHETPTRVGGVLGGGVGLATGLVVALFPFAAIGGGLLAATTAGGAVLGAVAGHAAAGMSRKDLKELGESLDTGQAGLVVVGVSDMGAKIESAMKQAEKVEAKELEGRHRRHRGRRGRRPGGRQDRAERAGEQLSDDPIESAIARLARLVGGTVVLGRVEPFLLLLTADVDGHPRHCALSRTELAVVGSFLDAALYARRTGENLLRNGRRRSSPSITTRSSRSASRRTGGSVSTGCSPSGSTCSAWTPIRSAWSCVRRRSSRRPSWPGASNGMRRDVRWTP